MDGTDGVSDKAIYRRALLLKRREKGKKGVERENRERKGKQRVEQWPKLGQKVRGVAGTNLLRRREVTQGGRGAPMFALSAQVHLYVNIYAL